MAEYKTKTKNKLKLKLFLAKKDLQKIVKNGKR